MKRWTQAAWRVCGGWGAAVLAGLLLTGCASSGLMGSNSLAEASLERAQTQALAAEKAEPEKAPPLATRETYLNVVRQMQHKQLWFASLAHLDALEKQWGVNPASTLLRADALRQAQRPQESAALYRQLIGSAQESEAFYGLGLLAADGSDFARSVEWMEKGRRSNPLNTRLLSDLGYAYLRAGQVPAAFMPLMQAAQLDPEYAKAAMNLALYWLLQGDEHQAQQLMEARQLSQAARQAIRDQAQALVQGAAPPVTPVAAVRPVLGPASPVAQPRSAPAAERPHEVAVRPASAPEASAATPALASPAVAADVRAAAPPASVVSAPSVPPAVAMDTAAAPAPGKAVVGVVSLPARTMPIVSIGNAVRGQLLGPAPQESEPAQADAAGAQDPGGEGPGTEGRQLASAAPTQRRPVSRWE